MKDAANHLPKAGIGSIFGLLEILDDLRGREDVYKLAQSLNYELDDMLPVLNAAALLGFIEIDKGDIIMTVLGKHLVEADVDGRKGMLRDGLLKHPVFRGIVEDLHLSKDKHISRGQLLELFEANYSPEESARQLSTVLDWGRYAELIGYNPDTEELYLSED